MCTKGKNFLSDDTEQLKHWKGNFGDNYINRNAFEDWKLEYGQEGFRRILGNLAIESILEVGSNIGLNLLYLSSLMRDKVDLFAVEPNEKAYSVLCANEKLKLKKAFNTSAYEIPLLDSSIDLVFTSGVLIHIAPENLQAATDEIVRIAKRYVLCLEYFSPKRETIIYRNQKNLLFKMDYGAFFLDNYPQLECVEYGFLWKRELKVFDDKTWWLFKKR